MPLSREELYTAITTAIEIGASGVEPEPGGAVDEMMQNLTARELEIVRWAVTAAGYERRMGPIRRAIDDEVSAATTTPDLVADWQKRAARSEARARIKTILQRILTAAGIAIFVIWYVTASVQAYAAATTLEETYHGNRNH